MDFIYEPIRVKRKFLVTGGVLRLSETGICLLHGNNGTGKTLLLNNIHANSNGLTVLVSQDSNDIITEINVAENIAMKTLEPDVANIRKLLERYNLAYLLDLNPAKMSGGEKRIVCLLRGILSSAPVVLIDEPTNDLDFEMVKKVVQIILDSSKEKCFLIVTHDDRLKSIANESLVIFQNKVQDNQLQSHQICLNYNSDKNYDFRMLNYKKGIETSFLKRFWNKKVFNLVSVLVMVILVSLTTHKVLYREIITEGQSHLPRNQISIMIPHSVYGSSTASRRHGTYPIILMNSILADNLWLKARDIDESVRRDYSNILVSLPDLPSTENYSVYPLEYFADRHYLTTLDFYLSYILETTTEFGWIDTSEYFYDERFAFPGMKYNFDPELFQKSIDEIARTTSQYDNNYNPIFYTIVFHQGYTLSDFLTEIPNEFLVDGVFIQTPETIAAGTKIKAILQYRILYKYVVQAAGILLTIELIYTLIYCSVKTRNIKILKNYGYDRNNVEKTILRVTNDLGMRILFILILVLSMYIILRNINVELYLQANYFLIICVSIMAQTGYFLKRLAIKLMLKYVFFWKYR